MCVVINFSSSNRFSFVMQLGKQTTNFVITVSAWCLSNMSVKPKSSANINEISDVNNSSSPDANAQCSEQDEERMQEMTASYSEISMDSQPSPSDDWIAADMEVSLPRPDHLDLQNSEGHYLQDLEGTVTREGDMVLFVAEDLETKIKLSSPVSKFNDGASVPGSRSSTPCLYRQALGAPHLAAIDPNVLNDLEVEARRIATSVDTLTENLAGILRSVSALTVDCVEIYRDAVCKTCDAVDSNIKAMYQLMAKCEELSKAMKPIHKLAEDVKEIKRLLDLLEGAAHS